MSARSLPLKSVRPPLAAYTPPPIGDSLAHEAGALQSAPAPPPLHGLRGWHTTTFRLFTTYSLVYSVCVAVLLGVIMCEVTGYMQQQTDRLLYWETHYFTRIKGADLVSSLDRRIQQEPRHATYYGLFDAEGRRLAGDISVMPLNLPVDNKGHGLERPLSVNEGDIHPHARALAVALDNGQVLVIARNTDQLVEIRNAIGNALVWGGLLALLTGVAAGLMLSVKQLRRIHETRQVIEKIVNGNLNERLPIGGRDELDMLAHLVNHMLDRIARLMAEVKGACDGVAHDLRTPLGHVLKTLTQARTHARTRGDAHMAGLLEYAEAETEALLDRFRAMLRISEIESMRRRGGFEEFALPPLLADLEDLYRPLAEEKGLAFSFDIDAGSLGSIRGDRALLFEALSNLLDNAIKFTNEGAIRLRLVCGKAGPQVDVIDSGPGIEAADRSAVLQRFYRTESSRHIAGSGLGLSIVSAVAALHDFGLSIDEANPGTHVRLACWPQTLA